MTESTTYEERLRNEQAFYAECENVHELPEIFHYWANEHLVRWLAPTGITNVEQFYFERAKRLAETNGARRLRIASIGSGNCDAESRLAQKLVNATIENFVVECIDINQDMLDRGAEHARCAGVLDHLELLRGDFNAWSPEGRYDLIIANQSLHHVLALERLFDTVYDHLTDDGVFLTSDMIGRNGHQRWPEAMSALAPFWAELPDDYRYNQLLRRHEPEYINHDCSDQGFEGIRAQDILPLLVERFHFSHFAPFANIVLVFIDRTFGHNFDATAAWDRNFIDRVDEVDRRAILAGRLTPTQMMAAMTRGPNPSTALVHPKLTPTFCVRHPG